MTNDQWQLIKDNFSDHREYIDGYYYRLRHLADQQYELALIHGGVCGENIYHPRLKLREDDGMLVPISLFDNYNHPVTNLEYQDAPEKLTDSMQNLIQQFLQAKELS